MSDPVKFRTLRSYSAHARFLAECDGDSAGCYVPVAWLARCQVEHIPSPYRYSPAVEVLRHESGRDVIVFETKHRFYEVFSVDPTFLRFKTSEAAEDWHIKYGRRVA